MVCNFVAHIQRNVSLPVVCGLTLLGLGYWWGSWPGLSTTSLSSSWPQDTMTCLCELDSLMSDLMNSFHETLIQQS